LQVFRGTVYLRNRTWTIGYTVGGRRVREAIGTNHQMAEAVLKKRIVQALEGRHFNVRNEGRIPFSEFAATYTDRCISVLKSAKTERDRVQFWVREFGSRPIGQIFAGSVAGLAGAKATDVQTSHGQPHHVQASSHVQPRGRLGTFGSEPYEGN
jgi:hypothetical protein